MNSKLTLTIEKSIIEKAKVYAKRSGRSLSDLIESYLARLVSSPDIQDDKIPEEFIDLFGSVNLSSDMDDKATIRSILREKYRE